MSGVLLYLLLALAVNAGCYPLSRLLRIARDVARWCLGCSVANGLSVILAPAEGLPGQYAGGTAIASLVMLALWWLSRRKRRDRARQWLGAKSKALRDALVRKARELSARRPVLVPGGAR